MGNLKMPSVFRGMPRLTQKAGQLLSSLWNCAAWEVCLHSECRGKRAVKQRGWSDTAEWAVPHGASNTCSPSILTQHQERQDSPFHSCHNQPMQAFNSYWEGTGASKMSQRKKGKLKKKKNSNSEGPKASVMREAVPGMEQEQLPDMSQRKAGKSCLTGGDRRGQCCSATGWCRHGKHWRQLGTRVRYDTNCPWKLTCSKAAQLSSNRPESRAWTWLWMTKDIHVPQSTANAAEPAQDSQQGDTFQLATPEQKSPKYNTHFFLIWLQFFCT